MMHLLLACHLIGLSAGVQVHQSPAALLGVAGDDAALHCSHGRADLRVMLWYQQPPGDHAVQLIGYGYTEFKNDSAEEPFRKSFTLSGDLSGDVTKTGVLSITKLEARGHTATYFCAASQARCAEAPSAPHYPRASGWFFTFNMVPSHFIVSVITAFWIEGVDLAKDKRVSQNPADVFFGPNDRVTLSLGHEIPSYDTVLWYHRPAGGFALTLVAYVYYTSPTVEAGFRSRFNVSGDGEKAAHLHVLSPRLPGDSGTYFGAASGNTVTYTDPAYFGQGTKLTVLEPGLNITKPTVRVLRPSPKECGKVEAGEKSRTIVCVASGFYPDHVGVLWSISDGDGVTDDNVTDGVATDHAARRRGKYYRISSRLRVSVETFSKDRVFNCTVSFFNGKDTEYVWDYIRGEPAGGGVITRDEYLMVTQTAKFSYGFLIIKSSVFGAAVALLVWRLQRSGGKQKD
ncbi:T cell receptor beta chain MC.7.G5-like [Pungitius pungitius]|uniref:T cell receptor beta chain MC.7.G5-like n=1 Tax=Pungitius pungitius TaxID=134920 RepID=UPI002E139C58